MHCKKGLKIGVTYCSRCEIKNSCREVRHYAETCEPDLFDALMLSAITDTPDLYPASNHHEREVHEVHSEEMSAQEIHSIDTDTSRSSSDSGCCDSGSCDCGGSD